MARMVWVVKSHGELVAGSARGEARIIVSSRDSNMIVPVTERVVTLGGLTGAELHVHLISAGVELNDLGRQFLLSAAFTAATVRRSLNIVEIEVSNLGLPAGGTIAEVCAAALMAGLKLCPRELGPHLRLQLLDQPEGFLGQQYTEHRAPPGSITIISESVAESEGLFSGFYLRVINGVPWLRGYQCDAAHVWSPDDHLVFCRPE